MPEKITSLTPEQEARFPEWREKWLAVGLSTQPAESDLPKAEAAALALYKACGLALPKVALRYSSPFGACMGGVMALRLLESPAMTELVEHGKAQGLTAAQVMPSTLKGTHGEEAFLRAYEYMTGVHSTQEIYDREFGHLPAQPITGIPAPEVIPFPVDR